uniref:Uncharacterized protein n=2 Tax=Zea mays TaxID=4577 RepID=A0A804LEF9_MAIZE
MGWSTVGHGSSPAPTSPSSLQCSTVRSLVLLHGPRLTVARTAYRLAMLWCEGHPLLPLHIPPLVAHLSLFLGPTAIVLRRMVAAHLVPSHQISSYTSKSRSSACHVLSLVQSVLTRFCWQGFKLLFIVSLMAMPKIKRSHAARVVGAIGEKNKVIYEDVLYYCFHIRDLSTN